MQVSIAVDARLPELRDAAACQRWLGQLAAQDPDTLNAIERLLRSLAAADLPPAQQLAIAELARPIHLRAIEHQLAGVQGVVFPMPAPERQRFTRACASWVLGRDLYHRLHQRARNARSADVRAVIPGATDSLAMVLPLIRALDYQVRQIVGLQMNRFAVADADWECLCADAALVRLSTFQDVVVPDDEALFGGATARALFIYPLLIELARPSTHRDPELLVIARLARRWSAKVGFRIESGSATRVSPNGPVLAISPSRVVRLDSQRLMSRLMAWRAELEAPAPGGALRLPRGLDMRQTRALLAQLVDCWSPGFVMSHSPDAPPSELGLRFGLPALAALMETAAPQEAALQPGSNGAPWQSAAGRASVYGRFEPHDALRGARLFTHPSRALLTWAAGAEQASRVGVDGCHVVVERRGCDPVMLGDLAAMIARAPSGAGQPAHLQFGRVTARSQCLPPAGGAAALQRIRVFPWAGAASLVGVRTPAEPAFDSAVLLASDASAGEPETLLLSPGRFKGPQALILRHAGRDQAIHLEGVLESGRGFERVRLHRTGI